MGGYTKLEGDLTPEIEELKRYVDGRVAAINIPYCTGVSAEGVRNYGRDGSEQRAFLHCELGTVIKRRILHDVGPLLTLLEWLKDDAQIIEWVTCVHVEWDDYSGSCEFDAWVTLMVPFDVDRTRPCVRFQSHDPVPPKIGRDLSFFCFTREEKRNP